MFEVMAELSRLRGAGVTAVKLISDAAESTENDISRGNYFSWPMRNVLQKRIWANE